MIAGVKSQSFPIERGVKQGDPISALLFIAVMEAILQRLKTKRHALNRQRKNQYIGLVVDDAEDPLANLRFADDVLLVASCKADIKKMIVDLKEEANVFGLTLHAGKTMVLTNIIGKGPASIHCDGQAVKVL